MTVSSRELRRACPALFAAALALALPACRPKPACSPDDAKGCVIAKIALDQIHSPAGGGVKASDVKDRLATAESSFFVTKSTVALLGGSGEIFLRYERFDALVLERDLDRIERYYRSRGYYEARVRAARVLRDGDTVVKVQLVVDEGPPTLLTSVDLTLQDPTKPLPMEPTDLAPTLVETKDELEVGARFEEDTYESTKRALTRAMTDRGYAYASVLGRAAVDLARHTARVTFAVAPGPPCTFGKLTLEGLGDLPEEPLRAAMDIEEGQPFSTEALDRAQAALAQTGVVGAVTVDVQRTPEGDTPVTAVPVRFLIQKAALRSIVIGGGAELGSRVRAHLITTWEHKNFLGGLRRFYIDGRAGILFYPLQLTNWDAPDPGVRPLPEVRLTTELRQPSLFERRTTGNARLEARYYRPDTADANVAQSALLFENLELHGTVGLERPFWASRVRLGTSLNGQFIAPVAMYSSALPSGFAPISIPYLEATAALDLRKGKEGKPDARSPHSGVYLGTSVQLAGVLPEGGWDLRIRPEFRAYIPISSSVTLAFRAASGLLFPTGYGQRLLEGGTCAEGDDTCNTERARSLQIMQLRGFYSGGIDTNRGYGRNGVNPQEIVLALFDTGQQTAGQTQRSPIGGRWLWEAQLELRFPIYESFGASLFVDTSDAWYADLLFRPHLSTGFGLRYATPIGPLRLDVGVRIPCAQVIGTCEELPPEDGGPPRPLDLPVNLSIAVGNPF
ncbi:MAG: BamA/TamA family outer membrane protein [Polyangiaceae bacterium]